MPTPKRATKSKKAIVKTSKSSRKSPSLEYQAADSFDEIKNHPVGKSKLPFIALLAVVILGLVIYLNKSLLVVAVVNGKPITRISLIKELEKQNGEKTLESLITKNLIVQEIAKQNITVSQDEITQEIANIETNVAGQGQDLDTLLKAQGINRQDLTDQITLQKQIEKILGSDIVVTDEEVNTFLESNQQFLPADQTDEQLQELAKKQLMQQKIDEKFQSWLDGLQEKANISKYL